MQNIWRKDFPILNREINGKPLVYLDNAATSQMPKQVLDAIVDFETKHRANVHRGAHTLSRESTDMFEISRKTIASFIGAVVPEEIVFVRNSTEAINLVAFSWALNNLKQGDVILVSKAEHHSNLVPWQIVAEKVGCELVDIPLTEEGLLDITKVFTNWEKVKFVSVTHASNVLGVVNDIRGIKKYIKKRVIEALRITDSESANHLPKIMVDASQSVPHMPVDVKKLGCDFLAFSGHKMCGPMGIGVLWVNRELFSQMKPFYSGGGMIKSVSFDKTTFGEMPEMLEAGTPNVSGAIGLAAAANYLNSIGMEKIFEHETKLAKYALDELSKRDDVIIYGSTDYTKKIGVIPFNIKNISAHDVAIILDTEGVAVRSGHHCVMPWHMDQPNTTTVRMSLYFYNTEDDIDSLITGLDKVKRLARPRK